jgi:hypothetical protein
MSTSAYCSEVLAAHTPACSGSLARPGVKPCGPIYCVECSDTQQDWVTWTTAHVTDALAAALPDPEQAVREALDKVAAEWGDPTFRDWLRPRVELIVQRHPDPEQSEAFVKMRNAFKREHQWRREAEARTEQAVRKAQAEAWNRGASDGLKTSSNLGYMLRNPYA